MGVISIATVMIGMGRAFNHAGNDRNADHFSSHPALKRAMRKESISMG